jgi:hypothetical protein
MYYYFKEEYNLLKFEQRGPKEWALMSDNEEKAILKLSSSSVTNKYHIVTDFIQRVAEHNGKTFSEWFVKFVTDCYDQTKRSGVVVDNIETIKQYCDDYMESLQINYNDFVDRSKAKKGSILFLPDEIKEVLKLSCYLKIYSVVSNNEELKLGEKLHRDIYNKFATNIIKTEIASKIFDVVKTKTFRYNLTDRFMWDYIKTIQCKDIGVHIIEIFNFIMNNIIILCDEHKNPITYFVGVIDESVKWFLRSVYKGTIVYDDEIATEDIHGTHINNLRSYSFNDTIGRLKAIAFDKIYDQLDQVNIMTFKDKTDQYTIDFNNRLSEIKYISPLCACLTFPLLAKITDISYVHFKTISPEHAAVLSYYLNRLAEKVFKSEYKNLFSLLDYYPESQPSLNTTYKIKSIHEFLNIQNKTQDFFGFNTKILPHRMLCHYIGRVSRINFRHLLTGQKLTGIPLSKIESDMTQFYTRFFANQLNPQIEELIKLMNGDF